jgi:hypothetical protein
LEIATQRDMLRIADVRHRGETYRAWVVTDAARRTGQARRLDGLQWPGPEGREFKSLSLRSDEDAPPGIADVFENNRPAVVIAEGEPDALAALLLAWLADAAERIGVVCLPGVCRGLTAPVLDVLKGRHVRILRQNDNSARKACASWLHALKSAGITCDAVSLDGLRRPDGEPAKDAADLCREADPDQLQRTAYALMAGILNQ